MGDTGLPWIEKSEMISGYTREQKYILPLYWIFTLFSTVGYGDFYGSTKGEYLITVLFMFIGILIFSMISFLVVKVINDNYDFEESVL